MKDFGSEFGELLQEQKALVKHYEEVVETYQKSQLNIENVKLKEDLEKLKSSFETISIRCKEAEEEVSELKMHIREQAVSEKSQLLVSAKAKMEIYFGKAEGEVKDKLTVIQQKGAVEIQSLKEEYVKKLGSDFKVFEDSLKQTRQKMNEHLRERAIDLQMKKEELSGRLSKEMSALGEETVTPEILEKRIKQNNFEVKVGLSWISKAGVLLILIGVIAAMKYSYAYFSAGMKGMFGVMVGLAFLGVGERFNQKKKLILGTALTGGGIGVLYLTVFWSYFALDIINIETAFAAAVFISIAAFVLSIRYNSKTIGVFALIGGYLPLLTYIGMGELNGNAIYAAMGYVLVLNLGALLIAFKKDWLILVGLSFASHFFILIYLTFHAESGVIALAYTFIVFTMYMLMILIYPFSFKQKLDYVKTTFIAVNTFLSCVIGHMLVTHFDFVSARGMLALIFCLVYFGLNRAAKKFLPEERGTAIIFGITALTFAVLTIPFQFGKDWIVLGWFTEALLIILFRNKIKSKLTEKGGLVIFGLCVLSFLVLIDHYRKMSVGIWNMLDVNYFIITSGALVIMVSYLREMKKDLGENLFVYALNELLITFKYAALFNLWVYLIYFSNRIYDILGNHTNIIGSSDRLLIFVIVTTVLAYVVSKINLLRDRGMQYVTLAMKIIIVFFCTYMNRSPELIDAASKDLGIIVLIVYNVLALFIFKDIFKFLIEHEGANKETYPGGAALYILFNATMFLKLQINLSYFDFIISMFYIISAFVLIIIGFKFKYRYIRYGALVLSIIAIAKLFLFDTRNLGEVYRIIAYFCFGLVLLGISFLYQRFSKTILPANKVDELYKDNK